MIENLMTRGEVERWRGSSRRPGGSRSGLRGGVSQHTDPGTADARTVLPRFQRPLPKPDMRFSLIRLSPRQSTTSIPRCYTSWPGDPSAPGIGSRAIAWGN